MILRRHGTQRRKFGTGALALSRIEKTLFAGRYLPENGVRQGLRRPHCWEQSSVACMVAVRIRLSLATSIAVPDSNYNFSFTAGGLLVPESIRVAECFVRHSDWTRTMAEISDDNLLQSRTRSTGERKLREIQPRLKTLTAPEIDLLVQGSPSEQLAVLWLATCKRYAFLSDFASQIVRQLYLSMQYQVTHLHVSDFLESQAVWHAEIEKLTQTTKSKVCTVTMRMLRESELTTEGGMIRPAVVTPELAAAISADDRNWFAIYPIADRDIPGVAA